MQPYRLPPRCRRMMWRHSRCPAARNRTSESFAGMPDANLFASQRQPVPRHEKMSWWNSWTELCMSRARRWRSGLISTRSVGPHCWIGRPSDSLASHSKERSAPKRTPKSRLQSEKMHERSNSNSDSDSDLLGLARTRPRKCCREILAAWCRITGFTAQSRANSAKRYPSKVATQSRISFQDSPDEARTPLRAGQQIWVRTPDG